MRNEAAISLKNITKVFVKRKLFKKTTSLYAVENVDLEILDGERLSIIGESGSGKTTLSRLAAGLLKPTKGYVFWFGRNISKLKSSEFKKIRPKIQYIHQNPYASINPAHTIYNVLADPLKRFGYTNKSLKEKVENCLKSVGLVPPEFFFDKYPRHLSGGGLQRLAIARALIPVPRVIIADEIVSMIDLSFRASIVKLLIELNERAGITIIMVSHDIGVARYFSYKAGRIAVMLKGRIVEIGPAELVIENPMHPYTRSLILASPVADKSLSAMKRELLPKYNIQKEIWEEEIMKVTGCRYAPYCPFAEDKCLFEKPVLKEIEKKSEHKVACHMVEKMPSWELKEV
jgi:peptide/nickel transport system ATP-binding protein